MEGRSREGSLRRTMAEYGEVLDLDERKPGSGNWLDANVAQVGEEGQFANSFLYLEQAGGSGDFPPSDFNPDHLLNAGLSNDFLGGLEPLQILPPSTDAHEAGGLLHSNSWRGIADYYVNNQGEQVEPLPERYVLPQWVKDLRIGPGALPPTNLKPSGGVLLKGLGTPLPPSPRSIRAAVLGLPDVRSDVTPWGSEAFGEGGGDWRTRGAAARAGGDGAQRREEEGAAAGTPLPWASSPYYPASTPGRKLLSPTNHSAAERRRRDRINDRFDILRRLIPGTQKADKATVLKAVIDYVSRLQAAGADNLLQKEATDEQTASHPQQQAAMSEVYTPTVSARSPGWLSEEEEATSLQDKVAVDVRDQSYVVRITCPTRGGLLFDVIATLKQLGLEVTDGELSSCRGRVLHVFYVPIRNVSKEVIKAKLEAAVFPGRHQAVSSPPRLVAQLGVPKKEAPVLPPEPPVQLQLPSKTQRKAGAQGTSNRKRRLSGGQ